MIALETGLEVLRAQHLKLRTLIADLKQAAKEHADVNAALAMLRAELVPHLYAEEAVIGPVLAKFDPQRFELLEAEHAHQRAVLYMIEQRQHSPALARAAADLADDLLADIEAEERDLFRVVAAHARSGVRTALSAPRRQPDVPERN